MTCEVFDVYLEPLVEELLELWEGIEVYDVTKDIGDRTFRLRTILLWTIHDFQGRAQLGDFHIRVLLLVHVAAVIWRLSIRLSLESTPSQEQGNGCQMDIHTREMP